MSVSFISGMMLRQLGHTALIHTVPLTAGSLSFVKLGTDRERKHWKDEVQDAVMKGQFSSSGRKSGKIHEANGF